MISRIKPRLRRALAPVTLQGAELRALMRMADYVMRGGGSLSEIDSYSPTIGKIVRDEYRRQGRL